MTCRVVVLVSGSGTLLQALLDETRSVDHPVTVVAVGADREGTGGVARAHAVDLPAFVVDPAAFADRESWGDALASAVAS